MINRLRRRHLLPVVVIRRLLPVVVIRRRHLRVVVIRRLLRVVVIRRRHLRVVVTRRSLRGAVRRRADTSHLRQRSRPGYPPQQGGYPAPGGYPPPAGPGYPGAQALNVGEAFSWAWNKFSKNAAALIVPTLVYAVIVRDHRYRDLGTCVDCLRRRRQWSPDGYSYSYEASFGFASILVLIVGYLILLVVGAAIQSAFLGGLLDIANGQPVTIGSFFKPRNVGSVIIASLIIGIAAGHRFRSASSVESWCRCSRSSPR